jgi:hypothetical protein
MIIVQLTGGLGNQMFQYTLALRISLETNYIVKIDTRFFKTYDWHEYSLQPFTPSIDTASNSDINTLTKGIIYPQNLKERILKKLNFIHIKSIVREQKIHFFDENVFRINDNSFLIGYWQSFKYFPDRKMLVDAFTPQIVPSNENLLVLNKILTTSSISLHIRRGNYVSVQSVSAFHGMCSKLYYDSSVEYIAKKVEKPYFFIFSDDIEWAKSNIKLGFETFFVDINNATTDYEDLRLMYSCKHNIIANSTFSWWGAFLNQNEDKIVIAPEKWYNDKNNEISFEDFIPQDWIRM